MYLQRPWQPHVNALFIAPCHANHKHVQRTCTIWTEKSQNFETFEPACRNPNPPFWCRVCLSKCRVCKPYFFLLGCQVLQSVNQSGSGSGSGWRSAAYYGSPLGGFAAAGSSEQCQIPHTMYFIACQVCLPVTAETEGLICAFCINQLTIS